MIAVLEWARRADWLNADRVLAYARIFVAVLVVAALGWLALSKGLIDPAGHPIGTDFLNVYAAGLMVWQGRAAAAYDWVAHGAVEASVVAFEGYYGWHYPPMFLFIAAPLAMLPYLPALGLYMATTFAAYAASVSRLLPAGQNRLWLAAGFPGVFVNLGHGQNGFLTTALLAGGLLSLERRPVLAGVSFGCLAYKPQFALLIPVALVAGGHWRSALSAAMTVGAIAGASLAVFGLETWRAFFASLDPTRLIMLEQGATGWPKIVSVFSAVRLLGGDLALAYGLQTLVTLATIAAVGVIWWRCGRHGLGAGSTAGTERTFDQPALAGGLLVLAIPLTTPYVLDYDLVVLAAAVMLLARAGLETGFRPWEKILLAMVTLAPLLARGIGTGLGLPIVPPLLVVTLIVFGARAFAQGSYAYRDHDGQA